MIQSAEFINDINKDQINGSENFLFKYCSVNINSLSILIKSSLYLGPIHNLNDPFEADFTIDTEGGMPSDDLLLKFNEKSGMTPLWTDATGYTKELKGNPEQFYADYRRYLSKRVRNEFGVSCFSTRCDNPLMWAHYSNSHTGFVIAFHKNLLEDSIVSPTFNTSFHKVTYSEQLPCIKPDIDPNLYWTDISYIGENGVSFLHRQTGQQYFIDKTRQLCTSKLKNWEYENEWRFLSHITPGFGSELDRYLHFPQHCIKGVILGCNMPIADRILLTSFIYDIYNKGEHQIEVYFAGLDSSNGTIKIRRGDEYPGNWRTNVEL